MNCFHCVPSRTFLRTFPVRYLEQVHPHTPKFVFKSWVLSGEPEMHPVPFLTESCLSGAHAASSYHGDMAKTPGWDNPLPVTVSPRFQVTLGASPLFWASGRALLGHRGSTRCVSSLLVALLTLLPLTISYPGPP